MNVYIFKALLVSLCLGCVVAIQAQSAAPRLAESKKEPVAAVSMKKMAKNYRKQKTETSTEVYANALAALGKYKMAIPVYETKDIAELDILSKENYLKALLADGRHNKFNKVIDGLAADPEAEQLVAFYKRRIKLENFDAIAAQEEYATIEHDFCFDLDASPSRMFEEQDMAFVWEINGEQLKGDQIAFCFETHGSHDVVLKSYETATGFELSDTTLVINIPEPFVFKNEIKTATVGEAFSLEISGFEAYKNLMWKTGDGNVAEAASASTHFFKTAGNYFVQLFEVPVTEDEEIKLLREYEVFVTK